MGIIDIYTGVYSASTKTACTTARTVLCVACDSENRPRCRIPAVAKTTCATARTVPSVASVALLQCYIIVRYLL